MPLVTSSRPRSIVLTLALFALVALPSASCTTNEQSSGEGHGDVRSAKSSTAAGDMKMIQGTWDRQIRPEEKLAYRRCVKEVSDGKEVVTYYGDDGQVQRQHQVQFRLERHGPVKVFTFFNHEVLVGNDKGKRTPEPKSYIYRLNGDELTEVWGFLPGQEERPVSYHVHRRQQKPVASGAQ